MGILLLAAFVGLPLLEIAVFVKVGGAIGLWPTLAIVILTAMVGTWQLRVQGLATLMRARSQLDQGALPTRELFDGACLLVAGALLLTPGFVTDTIGFMLFLPPVRDFLRTAMARHMAARGRTRVFVNGEEIDPGAAGAGPIIDGDYDDLGEAPDNERPGTDPDVPRRGLPR